MLVAHRNLRRLATGFIVGTAALIAGCTALAAADPNALWQIVDYGCVPAARTTNKTGVCASVDLERQEAVLKDRSGVAQHLLIPTERTSGIESPRVLDSHAPNYWADAWRARSYVQASLKAAKRAPLADNQIGLEINSAFMRTQEQLHIHIDCMRASASETLAHHRGDTLDQWTWDTIDSDRYRIMRVSGPALTVNPFDIVARDKTSSDAMARQTILVTGAGPSTQDDGWFIVNSGTDVEGGTGSAEVLLDHECKVAAHN
jgi:CDP-diacylglycerol pyrophosphatase